MFVLGQWTPSQVGESHPPQKGAALAVELIGQVAWRKEVVEVKAWQPILPKAVVHVERLEAVTSVVFKAVFHFTSLDFLQDTIVVPIVGQAEFESCEGTLSALRASAAIPDDKMNHSIYLSPNLIREAFKVNSFTRGVCVPLASVVHYERLPWSPDMPRCFREDRDDNGLLRSTCRPDAWHAFPAGCTRMRDRFTYEVLIPNRGNDRRFSVNERLVWMSIRFLTFMTPGPWSLLLNDIPIPLGDNPHVDLLDIGHPFFEFASIKSRVRAPSQRLHQRKDYGFSCCF